MIFEKIGYRVQKTFCFWFWISFLTFGKTVIFDIWSITISVDFAFFHFFFQFCPFFSLFWPKSSIFDKNHVFLSIFVNFWQFWHFQKWPFLRHFLTTFFWTFSGGPDLIGKTRAFFRIFPKPQKRVQKVVQKLVIFGTPKCPKWPKYWHFCLLPLGKMKRVSKKVSIFGPTFWPPFLSFGEIREKALVLPIKFGSPRKGRKKVIRKWSKNGQKPGFPKMTVLAILGFLKIPYVVNDVFFNFCHFLFVFFCDFWRQKITISGNSGFGGPKTRFFVIFWIFVILVWPKTRAFLTVFLSFHFFHFFQKVYFTTWRIFSFFTFWKVV